MVSKHQNETASKSENATKNTAPKEEVKS